MIDAIHLIKEKYYHARDLLLVIIIIVQLKNVHLLFLHSLQFKPAYCEEKADNGDFVSVHYTVCNVEK